MNKFIFTVFVFHAFVLSIQAQDFYNLPINSLDGKKIDLHSYKGKKVLIVIIPFNDSNANVIDELARFKNGIGSKVSIIGIPSIEEGYRKADDSKLIKLYRNDRNIDLVIAEGIKVKKASGTTQSELFKWLTDPTRNGSFNKDVTGLYHKFFVNEKGKLYAELGPRTSLFARPVAKIVNYPIGN